MWSVEHPILILSCDHDHLGPPFGCQSRSLPNMALLLREGHGTDKLCLIAGEGLQDGFVMFRYAQEEIRRGGELPGVYSAARATGKSYYCSGPLAMAPGGLARDERMGGVQGEGGSYLLARGAARRGGRGDRTQASCHGRQHSETAWRDQGQCPQAGRHCAGVAGWAVRGTTAADQPAHGSRLKRSFPALARCHPSS